MKTGLLKSVFDKLLSPGTSELEKPAEKNPVRIVNGIALTMCFLVMSVGFSFYCLNRSPLILYPVIIETLCFLSVLGLNHLEKYFRANLAMLVIHVIFAVYWSIVLGAAIQMELLIAFLALIVFHLSSAFVIYNERKVLIYCLAGTVVLMVGVQVNNHYALLKPLSFGPDIANVVRMVTSGAFMLLIIIIMTTYVFQIKNLLNSERKLKDASVAKSIFLRETYHELRTPLNAIFGIAQLMQLRKDEYATEEERQEIDDLYSACYVARNIINNVLDMSRIDAGRFNTISKESLNLRECIEHCVIMNRYVANSRGVRIEYQADKELPTVILSDKLVLIKIINNLLSNAVKFSSMKSTVEIKTFWNSQQLVFQIKNRGVISKEKVAKIFEPFDSERNQFIEGTGLGLHITNHLVELLGGNISVERDERGNSTTFAFNIPFEPGDTVVHSSPTFEHKKNNFHGAKAVIIDDDPLSRSIVSKLFTEFGIEGILCDNGENGLLKIKSEKPDIVITDMHMGKMSGKELLAHIRSDESTRDIPVIIISGDAFNAETQDILKAGADAYITKPFHFNELYRALCKHLPQFYQLA